MNKVVLREYIHICTLAIDNYSVLEDAGCAMLSLSETWHACIILCNVINLIRMQNNKLDFLALFYFVPLHLIDVLVSCALAVLFLTASILRSAHRTGFFCFSHKSSLQLHKNRDVLYTCLLMQQLKSNLCYGIVGSNIGPFFIAFYF